ncbi:hypothetical protein J3B02_000933 [Coemansia erecta]|nr:hypothetical protein J3B02_000933 [Coemansia erecta]
MEFIEAVVVDVSVVGVAAAVVVAGSGGDGNWPHMVKNGQVVHTQDSGYVAVAFDSVDAIGGNNTAADWHFDTEATHDADAHHHYPNPPADIFPNTRSPHTPLANPSAAARQHLPVDNQHVLQHSASYQEDAATLVSSHSRHYLSIPIHVSDIHGTQY